MFLREDAGGPEGAKLEDALGLLKEQKDLLASGVSVIFCARKS